MADGGNVETKDRDVKWPESRKLSSLISLMTSGGVQTHLRHGGGVTWGGTVAAERGPVPALPAPHWSRGSSASDSFLPSATRAPLGSVGRGTQETLTCPSGKRAKRPSAVSQFL